MSEAEPTFYLSKRYAWAHPCAGCCAMISEGDSEIEVERQYPEDLGGGFVFRRVWHQHCYNQYLDQNEEI